MGWMMRSNYNNEASFEAVLELYKTDEISLGKMAQMLNLPKSEVINLLDGFGIAWMEDNISKIEVEVNKWI